MASQSNDIHMVCIMGLPDEIRYLVYGYTELVFPQTGCNVGMGVWIDIRINPQREVRDDPQGTGYTIDPIEFCS